MEADEDAFLHGDEDKEKKVNIDVCEFGALAREDEDEEELGGLPPFPPSLSAWTPNATAPKARTNGYGIPMTTTSNGNGKRRALNLFGRRRNTELEGAWVSVL